MLRRLAPVMILLAAAACTGGNSSSSPQPSTTSASRIPEAQQLPAEGTVRYSGRVYTVAAPGSTLELDDVSLQIDSFGWQKNVAVAVEPPGTTTFGIFQVTVTNRGDQPATILPTQIWLLDTGNHPFIAAAGAGIDQPLIGKTVPAGKSVSGVLVYPVPKKIEGGLLLYRLADAESIAKAEHVGFLRY
jgi:hypothetical protein